MLPNKLSQDPVTRVQLLSLGDIGFSHRLCFLPAPLLLSCNPEDEGKIFLFKADLFSTDYKASYAIAFQELMILLQRKSKYI
jgi:hypothetical protein